MPILDQFRRGVDVAKFKADQLMRINRVQGEVGDLRREIQGVREKIATAAIELHKQGPLSYPGLEELCAAIDRIEAQIVEKEALIARIRAEVPPQATPPTLVSSANSVNPCPHCGFDAPVGAAFCPNCGKSIPAASEAAGVEPAADSGKCSNCGFSFPAGADFCPNCGQRVLR